jgi:hypothetical protein
MATTIRIHEAPTGPPLAVRAATAAWLLAVGSGVAETVVGVIGAIGDDAPVVGIAAQIAFRAVVYGSLFVIIDRYFRHGVPWSRWLLAGLLGIVGLATLVIGPVQWLITNGDFTTLHPDATFATLAAIRTVHILAVLTAVPLMFTSDANRWFHRK